MKVMWLNESLVLRGENAEEKRALNVVYAAIGNETDDVSHVLEFGKAVDVLKVPIGAND
jgi:hypothetical protein